MNKRTSWNHTYFTYWAEVLEVKDGDTMEVRCDCGLYTERRIDVRVDNVDTPETRGEEEAWGEEAKQFVISLLAEHGDRVTIYTKHEQSFARWVADVYLGETDKLLADAIGDAGYDKLRE